MQCQQSLGRFAKVARVELSNLVPHGLRGSAGHCGLFSLVTLTVGVVHCDQAFKLPRCLVVSASGFCQLSAVLLFQYGHC